MKLPAGIKKEDIKGYECKHAVYTKSHYKRPDGIHDDMVFIKENIHLNDGRVIPHTRFVVNYKRPFWITKPGFRKYKEKKEWQQLDKVDFNECTQAELPYKIKRALNIFSPTLNMRDICMNPYIYGTDIPVTAIIKHKYMTKWNLMSRSTVAVIDAETDMLQGHEEPILLSITFKDKAITAVDKNWAKDIKDYPEKLKARCMELIPDTMRDRKIELEVVMCDNPLEMVKAVIAKAHEWKPDFLTAWNMDFDIPKLLQVVERYGGNAARIFSDPSVPDEFTYCYYKVGTDKKVTDGGDESTLAWFDRWHTLHCPASWYAVDSACVFRKIRMANGKEPSMSLDAILKKYAGISKLKVDKSDDLSDAEWHIHMQKHRKVDYGVYNLFDCIGVEILDEQPKVMDLAITMPSRCGWSDYDKFPSNPRRAVDNLHFLCLQEGYVIGSTPKNILTEFDSKVTDIDGFIVTLPAHNVEDRGLRVIDKMESLPTLIFVAVYDLLECINEYTQQVPYIRNDVRVSLRIVWDWLKLCNYNVTGNGERECGETLKELQRCTMLK